MQAFIVRPFGKKQGVDFDRVEEMLIHPALEKAGVVGRSTGAITEAGNIRDDMFQLLLLADLVIADISIHNANVFYELGIRHALRTRQTYLIRARIPKTDLSTLNNEVPFDLKTDRYLVYDPDDPALTVDALTRGIKETLDANRVDSPVFRSLPRLKEADRSLLNPVPLTFVNDVDLAASKSQGGKLGLYASECGRMPWQMDGYRLVGRRQFKGSFFVSARRTWEAVKSVYPDDLEANLLLATVHQRLGELELSNQTLEFVLKSPDVSVDERTEAFSLRARNAKAAGRDLLAGKDLQAAVTSALRDGLFRRARDSYADAFHENLNHFYSGLNALSLTVLLCSIIEQQPRVWMDLFDTEEDASKDAKFLRDEEARLAVIVNLSIEAAANRAETKGDIWVEVSRADYAFLTASRHSVAAATYQRLLTHMPPFYLRAVRAQLDLFALLGVKSERVEMCLERFPREVPTTTLSQAVVFTGHMIDTPDRKTPRFPPGAESKARTLIGSYVDRLLRLHPGPALGIAGGASGGDILFHEVCRDLGVPTRVLLTVPENLYVEHSVAPARGDWSERFTRLMQSHAGTNEVQVLSSKAELPSWLRDPDDYDIWTRTNHWMLEEATAAGATSITLVALWDQQSGLAGGTQEFVIAAKERAVSISEIDARSLVD